MKSLKVIASATVLSLASWGFAAGKQAPPLELLWETTSASDLASINFLLSPEFQKALSEAKTVAQNRVSADRVRVLGLKDSSTPTVVEMSLSDCAPSGIAPGKCVELGVIRGDLGYEEMGVNYKATFIKGSHR